MGALTVQEYDYLCKELGRRVNDVEREIVGAEWSEHCSYKSSKRYLRMLPTKGKKVVVGPGYDAGVIDVGSGYVITVHIESHNHPSAIEPFGGAATGVGGVLRDIMSMGTRPIAVLNALRFGNLEKSKRQKSKSIWLFRNVVRGIADYGNCIGVPDIGGEVEFDQSFSDYCLVDVASVGFGKLDRLVRNTANPGDLLILVGGATGKDGIHGASFASSNLVEENRSAVQIPDPFLEKLVLEATMEAIDAGILKSVKDLGGGGLACCLSETSDSVGFGFEVELSNLHSKEKNMSATELMISESQERMLYVVDPSSMAKLHEILTKFELTYSKLGIVASHKDLLVKHNGKVIARMPSRLVAHAPLLDRPSKRPQYCDNLALVAKPSTPINLSKVILSLLGSPTIASKNWIYGQFDHEVGIRTVLRPGDADASVLRLDNGKFLSIKLDGNSKQCYINPYNGALSCLSEGRRNVICTGADPVGIVDHLQFGNPEDPEIFWTFKETIKAIVDYCNFMNIPVVGGKVSLYNETVKGPIKPTPVIGTLGLIDDASHITKIGLHEGDSIFLLGETYPELGGSEYYESYHSITGGLVPGVDLVKDRRNGEAVQSLVRKGLVNCAHDCSKGGLAIALCEMAIGGSIGLNVALRSIQTDNKITSDELLFSESNSRFVLGTKHADKVRKSLTERGLRFYELGHAEGRAVEIGLGNSEMVKLDLTDVQKAYSSLEKFVS